MEQSANPAITERIELVIRDLKTSIEEFENMKSVLEKIDISHIGSSLAKPYEIKSGLVVLRNQRHPMRPHLEILHELLRSYLKE